MARILLGVAGLYFMLGAALALHMGLIADYRLGVVYAHIGGLGFLALGLVGAIYLARPDLGSGIFAWAHFWLHMIGLPVLLIGLTMTQLDAFMTGHTIAIIGMVLLLVGAVAFTINVVTRTRVDVRV
ncbi:hypothetical protein [Dongia rigui]|uniref:Cytochrome-c oxidase n=1 Tax=Dongia rigui TaxID=940149 RepID=A0ABU5DXF6_9PROT|nr:hypothetical protein [Dongia rigui]MDY0871624.1 hypothetical protein [Dongia rigui]